MLRYAEIGVAMTANSYANKRKIAVDDEELERLQVRRMLTYADVC
jgi:hypothetical protein